MIYRHAYKQLTKAIYRNNFADPLLNTDRQATNNPLHANTSVSVPFHFNLPGHSITDMELIPLELQPTHIGYFLDLFGINSLKQHIRHLFHSMCFYSLPTVRTPGLKQFTFK